MPTPFLDPEADFAFSDEARRAVYEVISLRRDIRHFRPEIDVEPVVLDRILECRAPRPRRRILAAVFVVVRDAGVRRRIRESFLRCREAEAVR